MKQAIKYLCTIAIVSMIAYAGVQPSVGLYWTTSSDPTINPGVCAPQWQLLWRLDKPGVYVKTGAACTAWSAVGGASAGATVVTDGTSIQGDGSIANPITLWNVLSDNQTIVGNGVGVPLAIGQVNVDGSSIVGNGGSSPLQVGAMTGDVTSSQGNLTTTIGAGRVIPSMMANLAANSVFGNASSVPSIPSSIVSSSNGALLIQDSTGVLGFAKPTLDIFGSGVDSFCNFDGVTTPVAGATLSGSTYTLSRDIMCSSATVATGKTVKPNGFRIMVSSVLTMTGTASINANGGNGGTVTAGTAGNPAGFCAASGSAGTGANGPAVGGNAGAAGASAAQPYASDATGVGATGGQDGQYTSAGGSGGGAGANGGGTGGSFSKTAANQGVATSQSLFSCQSANNGTQQYTPGLGGGGGAVVGGTTGQGGGGGGGGGIVIIAANTIAGNASCTFQAKGGNGGNASLGNSTGAGGGGGGGGGIVEVIYWTTTGGIVGGCAASTAGGSRGTAAGTGAAAGLGNAGINPAFTRFNLTGT